MRLDCGHSTTVLTGLDLSPGHEPRRILVERLDEMRRDVEEIWTKEAAEAWPEEGPGREHMCRMLELRLPRPEPEQECWPCGDAKKVAGYQRIG